jgi:queuine tRNA-ribosyltransferase
VTHELVRTRGGALAVRDVECGEVMHPGVGPRVEAELLYVKQARLVERLAAEKRMVLFDVGLGAGSNAFAALAAIPDGTRLEIVSFERDLGALDLALANAAAFGLDAAAVDAGRALRANGTFANERCSWHLRHGELLPALAACERRADVVFWDPFSPKANPSLWTEEAFAAIRRCAAPGCSLFTYSGSTATRVAMLLGGWAVGVGDSIGDKAETTACAVRVEDLARPLDARWLGRLQRSSAVLPEGAAERVARLEQFSLPGRSPR